MAELPKMRVPQDLSYIFFALVISLVAVFISYYLWSGSNTQPTPYLEGFAGPVNGVSEITCGSKSIEATRIYSIISAKSSTTETAADDLLELKQLLGKLACVKQDLLAPGSLVNASKNAQYITSQDIEPASETVARCFAKTVPKRDLEISLDKWTKRGDMLIRRLCTSYNLDTEEKDVRALFSQLVADVTDILMTTCLKGPVTIGGEDGPRMVEGREATGTAHAGEYKGYY